MCLKKEDLPVAGVESHSNRENEENVGTCLGCENDLCWKSSKSWKWTEIWIIFRVFLDSNDQAASPIILPTFNDSLTGGDLVTKLTYSNNTICSSGADEPYHRLIAHIATHNPKPLAWIIKSNSFNHLYPASGTSEKARN